MHIWRFHPWSNWSERKIELSIPIILLPDSLNNRTRQINGNMMFIYRKGQMLCVISRMNYDILMCMSAHENSIMLPGFKSAWSWEKHTPTINNSSEIYFLLSPNVPSALRFPLFSLNKNNFTFSARRRSLVYFSFLCKQKERATVNVDCCLR